MRAVRGAGRLLAGASGSRPPECQPATVRSCRPVGRLQRPVRSTRTVGHAIPAPVEEPWERTVASSERTAGTTASPDPRPGHRRHVTYELFLTFRNSPSLLSCTRCSGRVAVGRRGVSSSQKRLQPRSSFSVGLLPADRRLANYVPWAVGGLVDLVIVVLGTATGGSANPARQFGPAVISGQTRWLWVYLSAPILGALLAAQLRRVIQPRRRVSTHSLCGPD